MSLRSTDDFAALLYVYDCSRVESQSYIILCAQKLAIARAFPPRHDFVAKTPVPQSFISILSQPHQQDTPLEQRPRSMDFLVTFLS